MARIILEVLEKTKKAVKDMAKKGNKTMKEILLEGVGLKDE